MPPPAAGLAVALKLAASALVLRTSRLVSSPTATKVAPSARYLRASASLGAGFVAVGLDTNLLVRSTSALAASFKGAAKPAAAGGTY